MPKSSGETLTVYAARLLAEGLSPDQVMKKMEQEGLNFPQVSTVLLEMLGKYDASVEYLADLTDSDPATLYRILNKQRNPGRNLLLRIALALGLSLDDTQILLKSANRATLSPVRERDIFIMDSIIKGDYYEELNETLTKNGMADLNGKG